MTYLTLNELKTMANKNLKKACHYLIRLDNAFMQRHELKDILNNLVNHSKYVLENNVNENAQGIQNIANGVTKVLSSACESGFYFYYEDILCEDIDQVKVVAINSAKDILDLLDYMGLTTEEEWREFYIYNVKF